MADRFEQWSRAQLGEYVEREGEVWATVLVPVDGAQHDPRVDVIASLGPDKGHVVSPRKTRGK